MSAAKSREGPETRCTVPCPTCGKGAVWSSDNKWRPFCSERCRLIDLGEWLTEEKRIPGEPEEPQESWPSDNGES